MKKRVTTLIVIFSVITSMVFAAGSPETGTETEYPRRSIQFVVPFPVGGSTGTPAQVLIRYLDEYFEDVDVVLGSITGAGGSVGARHVMNARPDGYTFLIAVPGFSVQRVLANLDFTFRDFEQVAAYGSAEQVLVVRGDSDYEDFDDLINTARDNPGRLNIGAPIGTSLQLAKLAMESEMGVDFNIVDIGGVAVKPPELLSGRVEAYIDSTALTIPFIRSGDFKPLGIWGPQRSAFLPDVPALNEFGFETVLEEVQGIWAPKGTPEEVLNIMEEAIRVVTSNPSFIEAFEGGTQTTVRFRNRTDYQRFLEEYEATVIETAAMME